MLIRLAVLILLVLTVITPRPSQAAFADLELIRIYYNRSGVEIGTDLGAVETLAQTASSSAGAFTATAGSVDAAGFAVYFSLDRGTNRLWASGSTTIPSVINGTTSGLTGIKNGTTNMYSTYNLQGGTDYSGLVSAINSYKNKLSGTQGTLAAAINNTTRLNTEISIAPLINATSTTISQYLYFWVNGLTSVALEKIGVPVAQIDTAADGFTTITPLTLVTGSCGTAHQQPVTAQPTGAELCTNGVSNGLTGSGPWTWNCLGQGVGGSHVACSSSTIHTVNATYVLDQNNLSNGTISCQSPIAPGGSSTCTITPDPGFQLTAITDNGLDVFGLVNGASYTIANINENHALVGTFSPGSVKITPTITWSNPADITYGTPLGGSQLNAASGGVAGTFNYTPPAGTILNAGSAQTLTVNFTPTDTATYNTPAPVSVTINVNKAIPALSWATPAAIDYGTTLSATQLNASSNGLPGTFVYTPASGTLPNAGTQLLSTIFTPNDTTNYGNAGTTVNLTVNPTVQILGLSTVFNTLQGLLAAIPADTTVQLRSNYTTPTPENLIYNGGFTIMMAGGLDAGWNPTTGVSVIQGSLKIQSGKLIANNIAIR